SARPAASRRGYPQWTGASGGPFDLRCLQTVAPVACRSDVRPHVGAAARQRNDVVDRCAVRLAPIGRRVDPPLADMTNPVVAFKDFTIGVTVMLDIRSAAPLLGARSMPDLAGSRAPPGGWVDADKLVPAPPALDCA